MAIPVFGMFLGLLTAILFTYRKKRVYDVSKILEVESEKKEIKPFYIFIAISFYYNCTWITTIYKLNYFRFISWIYYLYCCRSNKS